MIWIKESGLEIETNDLEATVKHCEELGWKQKEEKKKAGRPKKEEVEAEE